MATKSTKSTKSTRSTKPAKAQRAASPARQEKPVFRTGTLVTLVLFIAVIGGVLYMNRQAEQEASATETPAAEEAFIFSTDGIVNAMEISPASGATVRLERNEEKLWVLSKPEEAEADQGAAEAAASQILALKIIQELDSSVKPSVFGFDEPSYTLSVELEGSQPSMIEVGDLTPSQSGYYVRVDGKNIYVVATSGIDSLTSLIFAPPYLNTPTPSPTATNTPLPTETPASTPEVTPTP